MNIYLSEDEQVQKVRAWCKEYGTAIIVAIIVFLAGSFSWRYWQQYEIRHAEQASDIYEQMVMADTLKHVADVKLLAKHLQNDYRSTPYATFASLALAREALNTQNFNEAEQNLDWVVAHGDGKALKQIARLREARVLLTDNQPQKALKLLQKIDDPTFAPMIHMVKGDSLLAINQKSTALLEYKTAKNLVTAENSLTKMLDLKINQITTDNDFKT